MLLLRGGTKLGFVYILECEHDTYYVGYATKLHARLVKHFSGRGAIFTQICKPKSLLAFMPGNPEDEPRTATYWRSILPGRVVGGEATALQYFRNIVAARPQTKQNQRWPSTRKRLTKT